MPVIGGPPLYYGTGGTEYIGPGSPYWELYGSNTGGSNNGPNAGNVANPYVNVSDWNAARIRAEIAELAARGSAAGRNASANVMSAQAALARLGMDDKISLRELQERMRQFDLSQAESRRQFDASLAQRAYEFNTTENRERAAMILNAPKGPADAFTYLARMRSLAQRGFVTDALRGAIEGATGMSMGQLEKAPVLTGTQFASGLVDSLTGRAMDPTTGAFLSRTFGQPQSAVGQSQPTPTPTAPPGPTQEEITARTAAEKAEADRITALIGGITPVIGRADEDARGPDPIIGFNTPDGFISAVHRNDIDIINGTMLPITEYLYNKTGHADWGFDIEGRLSRTGRPHQNAAQFAADQTAAVQRAMTGFRESSPPLYKGGGINQNYKTVGTPTPPPEIPRNPMPYMGGSGSGSGSPTDRAFGVPGGSTAGGALSGTPYLLQNPLGGFKTSAQEFGRLQPSAQAAYLNLVGESGGEMPEDFLSELRKGALSFRPSSAVRFG